jgi:hypothetical protein
LMLQHFVALAVLAESVIIEEARKGDAGGD